MSRTIHVTLTTAAWQKVRKVANHARTGQPDNLLGKFVGSIDKHLAAGTETITGSADGYATICNRLLDSNWHLKSDIWPLVTAVRRATNAPEQPAPPVPAADIESAKAAAAEMDRDPGWRGFVDVEPETAPQRTLF